MAYQTYITEALVCGNRPSNTSDRSYLLFTERAGMIWATARSVREEKSKQRYALQDFSLLRVSLVKGKSGWRIGSVEANANPFMEAKSRTERAHIAGIVTLLRRYIHGEEPLPEVFRDVMTVLNDSDLIKQFETVKPLFEARLLFQLGHLLPSVDTRAILEAPTIKEAQVDLSGKQLSLLEKAIQHAHQESQL